ncbi:Z1 domain-containing protein [Leifsonia sp. F6_8S_P_1B]|uniref:Z1 domain-containing protein n=1 Tax=Leifsonia williamsii TaxID=3035919 RepID=A0ABT8KBN9_9MICO|nr:Z1 domain-containing protein [Leifsonia williamsii]MDN4614577.1 Z1 domain-containing protein [Leifsonia williamsii]
MDHVIYPMFADWARRHGVENAVDRLSAGFPSETLRELADFYNSQVALIENGGPAILKAGGDAWYPGPSPEALYWNPLRDAFRTSGLGDDVIASVDRSSSKVVAHTPQPTAKSFDGKGLVVGYVQSGKTTNFISVIAKMADEDYRFVIVLAGVHNGLRKQTQARLSSQLHAPNATRWHLLTDENGDFQTPASPPVSVFSDHRTALAVVKKNAAVLARLIKWLDTESARSKLADMRVLIIDDEADQASVATRSINPKIRKLLELTPKHTYIGYTATPFANVFIDPASDDLYPKSFILNLPRPDGYFGPERIFGNDLPPEHPDSNDGYDMIRAVPGLDIPKLRPRNKAATASFRPEITDELRRAVLWFLLATAARHARGQHNAHSTMLIHTAIPVTVHRAFHGPISDLLASVRAELDEVDSSVQAELRSLWDEESSRVPASDWGRSQNSYEEIATHLASILDSTRVILDNSMSDERLLYQEDEPLVAIAIGGNTLSRGLTLEGLVVSFFVRSANTYDTLMQMGRWFGYRTGYEDLPRIWMTEELEENFRHLVTVEREMRDDIEHYQRQDLTPLEAAVRIRTHPSLRITAKMGAATPHYVSFAGRRLYTRYFKPKDAAWLEKNLKAADELVSTASTSSHFTNGRATLFEDVSWTAIRRFLSQYEVHEDSPDLDRKLMLKYIQQRVQDSPASLEAWTVAVVEGPEGNAPIDLGSRSWRSVIRARLKGPDSKADIKNVMNRGDRGLDLERSTGELDAMSEQELVALRETVDRVRDKGLLVLYPIDALSAPQTERSRASRQALDAVGAVVGFGIVFPGEPEERKQLKAGKVAVDLSDVTIEDPSTYEDDLEGAAEGVR